MALRETTQEDSCTSDTLWQPSIPMLEGGPSHCTARAETGRWGRVSQASLWWRFQTHPGRVTVKLQQKPWAWGDTTHLHRAQLVMIISREPRNWVYYCFPPLMWKATCGRIKHKWYKHYRGKNAPECDVKHRYLTTGSLYEQARGGKDIQEQGML